MAYKRKCEQLKEASAIIGHDWQKVREQLIEQGWLIDKVQRWTYMGHKNHVWCPSEQAWRLFYAIRPVHGNAVRWNVEFLRDLMANQVPVTKPPDSTAPTNLNWTIKESNPQYPACQKIQGIALTSKQMEDRKASKPNSTAQIFSDFPTVTHYSIRRDYDPSIYGFPRGTLPPITDKDAQDGRHRISGCNAR